MVIELVFIVTWSVICPIENHEVSETKEQHNFSWKDKSVIECPKHHLLLVSRPKKAIKREKRIKPGNSQEPTPYVETETSEEELFKTEDEMGGE